MKMKAFALGVLSLAGLALSASTASAVFPHCFHRNYSMIICRPYNAFTPICCGNIVCDGCGPSPYCGGPTCQLPIQHCLGPVYGGGGYEHGILPDYAGAGSSNMLVAPPIQYPASMPAQQNFAPPPPTPSPVYNQTSMRWNPQGMNGVQPAGYYPGYYPNYQANYYPVNNYPMAPASAVPYYWYNGR